jgi:hypothetical protein
MPTISATTTPTWRRSLPPCAAPETLLTVLLDPPPSVTCAAVCSVAGGESHRVCGAENSWNTTLVSAIPAEYPGILAQYLGYWGGIMGGVAPLSHDYSTGRRTAGTQGIPRAQHRRRRSATPATRRHCATRCPVCRRCSARRVLRALRALCILRNAEQ